MRGQERAGSKFNVSKDDEKLIESLLSKVDKAWRHSDLIGVIERTALASILSAEEITIIDRVYNIDPTIYGFYAPRLSTELGANKLIRVAPQRYRYQNKKYYTHTQYVPETPHRAYQAMAVAMKDELKRPLLIESSYRSNPYQAIVFLSILKLHKFDVNKTAKRAAIPGYSEHSTPDELAFDFMNRDGLPSYETPQDFEGTVEFNWLTANANHFDFFMSYPKDNPYGLMYEPWHWRHKPTDNSSFILP
jgi:LAS superfamily LD-carboxypeptidase LdcB